MNETDSRPVPAIEHWAAGLLLCAPALAAWGLACLARVQPNAAGGSGSARDAFLLPLGYAITAAACLLCCVAYFLYCALRRRRVGSGFVLACLAAGVGMFAATVLGNFLWDVFGSLPTLVALAASCLTVGYALAFLASRSIRSGLPFSWKESALPASVAGLWLLFGSQAFTGFGHRFLNGTWLNFLVGLVLASLLIVAFCVARVGYHLAAGGRGGRPRRLASRIVFCLILPFAGIGTTFLAGRGMGGAAGFLEFLATPGVVVLAALSGASLCLREPRRLPLRLALACLRSACLPFSAYVMLVFLPFMPAIPFAIFLFGAGILLAVPLANFLCHLSALRADLAALRGGFGPRPLGLALGLSFLALPVFIAGQAAWDRVNLKAAIAWVGADEPGRPRFPGDRGSVLRALEARNASLGRFGDREGPWFPLVDDFRGAVVFGPKKLNERTVSGIEAGFGAGKAGTIRGSAEAAKNGADFSCSASLVSSAFDPEYGLMRSRVELRPRYAGRDRFGEFRLSFQLPRTAWLQGYYLYVGNEKKAGRIFERAAAVSVYESILRRRRDPGILSVSEGNLASLRVFPFAAGEERRTGFDILHSGAFRLAFGGSSLDFPGIPPGRAGERAAWIVAPEALSLLPPLARRPYIHVIADASAASLADKASLMDAVRLAARTALPPSTIEALPVRISFVDYEERARTDTLGAEAALGRLRGRGGFLPYRAIQSIAIESAKARPYAFPVFVVARARSPLEWTAGHPEDFPGALARLFPETDGIFGIDGEGKLAAVGDGGAVQVDAIPPFRAVARFMRGGTASIARVEEGAFRVEPGTEDPFALLAAARDEEAFSAAGRAARYAKLHRLSKECGILSPATSSIVLEADAQYAEIGKRERENLADEATLTELGLSTPGLAILLCCASLAVLLAEGAARRRRLIAGGSRPNPR